MNLPAISLHGFRTLSLPLYRNSFFLLAGTVVSSLFGFLFWLLAARVTNAAAIGIASAALSATNLLMALIDFGLGTSLVYYGASSASGSATLVDTVTGTGWLLSTAAAVLFLIGLPVWSPGLFPLRTDLIFAGTFVLFTACNYSLSLQDAAMMARRQAGFAFLRALATSAPPILLLLAFTRLNVDSHLLFLAYGLPNIVTAIVAGIWVLPRFYPQSHLLGCIDLVELARIQHYSSANYIANLLWGLPAFLMPIVAVNVLSPDMAGVFFVIWTLFNFTLIIPRSVSRSLFTEGVIQEGRLWQVVLQSITFIWILVTPTVLALWWGGQYLLALFGDQFVNVGLLRTLLLSIFLFSINSVQFTVLRLQRGGLLELIIFTAITACAVLGPTYWLAPRMGVQGIALGWLAGQAISTLVVLVRAIRHGLPARRGQP